MLFLLRQLRRLEIRQRSGRYFLYAVGEVVLIVVGILIAFQVEEWRTERINDKAEKVALEGLLNDLRTDQERLEGWNEGLERQLDKIDQLAGYLQSGETRTVEKLAALFASATRLPTYIPSAPTYLSLEDTGRFNLIKDQVVLEKTHVYFGRAHPFFDRFSIGTSEVWRHFLHAALLDMYVATDGQAGEDTVIVETSETGRLAVRLPLETIPRNPEFMGHLGLLSGRMRNGQRHVTRTMNENQELIETIEAYLKSIE